MNLSHRCLIKPLQKGDKVAIAATARKVTALEMEPAIALLTAWGLEVVLASGIFLDANQFAGDDASRAQSLQLLLDDDSIKAIFCARGGYGTVRIIDKLNFSKFVLNPKWLIGFSDITVLQSHLHQNFGIPSIHGPMAFNFTAERANQASIEQLHKVLFGEPNVISFPKHPLNLREHWVQGILIGGNLSVLISILGSTSDIDTANKILFLEDLDEYLYHIDRMMLALKRAGKLQNLKALVIGDMSDMKDNAIPFGKTAFEIIIDAVKEYNYPVFFGAPCGHEALNMALVLGKAYEIKVEENSVSLNHV